jgi:hypothetical protein
MRYLMTLAQLVAAGCLALMSVASAQNSSAPPGAVPQAIPPAISQTPKLPPLDLSDDQRAKIKQALRKQDTEVSFGTKTTKAAKSFEPAIGAKLPAGLKAHALPPPAIYEMPLLKRYSYVKFKHQVLLVDPMTHKIVDMFGED